MIIKFFEDGKTFMGFAEYVSLKESVIPRETDYGLDGKDKNWHDDGNSWHHTLFSHTPEHHVMVAVNKDHGGLAFGTHRGKFTNDVINHYEAEKTNTNDAFRVFSKVMHVGLEGAKTHNMKKIRLKGHTDALSHAYDKFVQNKHIIHHMKNHGYSYSGKDNTESHVFTKDQE